MKTQTIAINMDDIRNQNIKDVLTHVSEALTERGYNAVNQIAGYLITNDPAYISGYKNARSVIQTVERHEIIEALVREYLRK
ncbi:MAG: IreB family regulatory phosphoprotein [Erysipelotrichales bacterium]|nr:IreB family regulatory phosphoprotein [Erysipelotrichales bacterium]MBQ1385553.1 IreB family regulatory phosphoprotein [Erysipelotrichales bacterium]MBQ2310788.1 IreB family regulatory phosphoprotein [Erysipelotrichales bacterium]MBQ2479108.1 IreB family regulatory phosphoprotein [Erysipelotrichales bacterium]MBQ4011946.1 IreB family regulatory phosphoprotein [Erysipelotrichales bacterium]